MPLAAAAFTAVATAALALATAALALATAALATATATAALAALAATAATLAVLAAPPLLFHHLRPMHRRSERPELHSLAQLSVALRPRAGVLHRADCARHWKAPDIDPL